MLFLIVGAVYVDLDYELPTEALKSLVDIQLFCQASFRVGGTGYNQASILARSVKSGQSIKLITLLGHEPVSVLAKELIKGNTSTFDVDILDTAVEASPPIVSILRERLGAASRRIMIGPPNRYISSLWAKLSELNNEASDYETTALIFDGYSLTSYELSFELELRAFTKRFASSTLILLPHEIYTILDRTELSSALKCFSNLDSSFYTVSRIFLGVGDTGIPGDDLIVATLRQLVADCPNCELNLRFGAMDAQFCAHFRGGSDVLIIEYEIDHLGERSVGDQLQIQGMVNPSALIEKHRRKLSI